jgi:hypothetical protein
VVRDALGDYRAGNSGVVPTAAALDASVVSHCLPICTPPDCCVFPPYVCVEIDTRICARSRSNRCLMRFLVVLLLLRGASIDPVLNNVRSLCLNWLLYLLATSSRCFVGGFVVVFANIAARQDCARCGCALFPLFIIYARLMMMIER